MKKIAIALATLALAGCATTSNRIKEPERTQYYYYCIANGILATTCQCMEEKAVKETGTTSLEGLDSSDPKVTEFIEVLQGSIKQCDEETRKGISESK